MKKVSNTVASMMQEFLGNQTDAMKKLKADCHSFYGFVAAKGKLKPFLRPNELAHALSISIATLERMRRDGTGPQFFKVGNRQVRYPVVHLDEWVAEKMMNQDKPESPEEPDESQGL